LSSPAIYNRLRIRKADDLKVKLAGVDKEAPILVGCPSCKIGISRALMQMRETRPVLHTVEYMAQRIFGYKWKIHCRKLMRNAAFDDNVHIVDMERVIGLGAPGDAGHEHEDED
jgi:hypothetical protein